MLDPLMDGLRAGAAGPERARGCRPASPLSSTAQVGDPWPRHSEDTPDRPGAPGSALRTQPEWECQIWFCHLTSVMSPSAATTASVNPVPP